MQVQKAGGDDVLLDVRDLETHFFGEDNVTRALGGISFQVNKGETLGVVGESGCGKSVTALSILRLLPKLTARTVGGEIRFHGRDLLRLSDREMRQIRGDQIAMIFQEPMTSLNPVYTVGHQIAEAVQIHTNAPGPTQWTKRMKCSVSSASRIPSAASTTTRMRCQAACASAS